MAREVRRGSRSGYLHLIVRGNNKQILFEDTDDYRFFLSRVGKYCRETEIRINAYCLMENHVHLLVNDPEGHTSEMMQKLGVSYTNYYNHKYERSGHLFQGRYLSEPVEDDVYLLTVFRYVLNNPRKAGICSAAQYRWNSYKAYFKPEYNLDLDFIRDRFRTDEAYREFINGTDDEECLDYDRPKWRNGDDKALKVIHEKLNLQSGTEIQAMERKGRDQAIKILKREGLTVRQIERLTGINRNTIQRVNESMGSDPK